MAAQDGTKARPGIVAALDRAAGTEALVQHLHRSLLDTAQPLYICDPKGRLLYANTAYRRIRPALAEAGGGLGVAELIRTIETLGGPIRRELSVSLDGGTSCFLAEYQMLRGVEGEPLALIGGFTPIDEMKRSREALKLSEDRFNDIARLVSDLVWETDRMAMITYISPGVSKVLGYHPRELLGEPLGTLKVVSAGQLEALSLPGPHAPFRDVEVELTGKDGVRRTFRVSGLPVYCHATGEWTGFRGTAQDVTTFQAHEAALFDAVDAAEAANRAKSEFLANMSHELRTPLNAIIGFSDVIKDEHFGPVGNARYRSYAGDILASAHHLLTVIDDILDVAKIEAGKLDLDEAPIHPAELGRQALRLVADRARRAGVALEAALPGDLPRLLVDGRKMKQILLNLLSNAIKFTPKGGRVELSAGRRADGGFAFAVSDTGIGIAPADQATALAPFGQVDSQLSRKFEGTGLGLPLSNALAKLHGGTLELESTPDTGTTVTIRLPAERVVSGQGEQAQE
ncbi:MAG: ATP-binding protein [Rhodospirillales bacterium]|nr:ATP-binding protein [Rhodospirillales bacterium]MDH3967369.1 ATP-binding protein [Rhodospirillales bacterium]